MVGLFAWQTDMDGQVILALLGIVSSFGSAAFIIIKGVLDSKKKELSYELSQRVNKADWISWLGEAKREIAGLKQEIKELVEEHRKELNEKNLLIDRLQRQINDQAVEIHNLQQELRRWKDRYPERKEDIKDEVRNDMPEFMIKK